MKDTIITTTAKGNGQQLCGNNPLLKVASNPSPETSYNFRKCKENGKITEIPETQFLGIMLYNRSVILTSRIISKKAVSILKLRRLCPHLVYSLIYIISLA